MLPDEPVNHRTIQLLMGVTGLGPDQFVEMLFLVRQAEYQDYLYVLAGREQTRMLFYWDITMQSRPNAQPVQVTPITRAVQSFQPESCKN